MASSKAGSRGSRFWRRLRFILVTLGVVLIDVSVAIARAGGGGGYSSGGSSSSSSSYSSSSSSSYSSGSSGGAGGGELFLLALYLVGLIAFYFVKRRMERAAADARLASDFEIAAILRERDPSFDPEKFRERVESAFMHIQEAWSNQDLRCVRGFMSDGVFERFSIQIEEQRAQGYRNEMSRVRIRDSVIEEVRQLEHFDVIAVKIRATASDRRLSLATGALIEGTTRSAHFTETWSFLRGRDAQSADGSGLIEGNCPNCSASVDPERIWACASCGAGLESAPPDWVLIEITQRSEWARAEHADHAWWKVACARDPGLTVAQLEDRASVLFWRLMDCDRRGDVARLASVARPDFLQSQGHRLRALGDRYTGDCSVGSAELRGFVPGEEWDLALVEIRWSGNEFNRSSIGGPQSTGDRRLCRSLLVMARRAGVESQVGRCITSAHCSQCGAPEDGQGEGEGEVECGFCGAVMNDGRDWLIDQFLSIDHADARTLLREASWVGRSREPASQHGAAGVGQSEPTSADEGQTPMPMEDRPPGGEELYAWCLRLAYSDDRITGGERQRLAKLADRLGIASTTAREMRRAAQFSRLEVDSPGDRATADIWLRALKDLASVDGQIAPRERRVVAELEARLSG